MSVFAGQYLSEKEKEWKDVKTRSIMTDTVRFVSLSVFSHYPVCRLVCSSGFQISV